MGSSSGGNFVTRQTGVGNLAGNIMACKALCEADEACVATESNSSGGCEIWYQLPTRGSGNSGGSAAPPSPRSVPRATVRWRRSAGASARSSPPRNARYRGSLRNVSSTCIM